MKMQSVFLLSKKNHLFKWLDHHSTRITPQRSYRDERFFSALPPPPEAPIWQACHSQGTAQVRNTLETYSKERRGRIIVAAFAPLAYISPKLCMQVNHYVCPSDPTPCFDFIGKRKYKKTITYVKRMPHIKQSCHEFLNPIYLPYIKDEIESYQDLLKKYDH